MSVPASLSPAPLKSFGDFSAKKLFDDDYSCGKASLKVKASTPGYGVANYKGAIDMSFKKSPTQETKFQFPYNKYYFWFATRPGQTKLHVDFGKYNLVKEQSLFANVQFDDNFKSTIRVGTVYEGKNCLSHARLEYLQQNKVNFLLRSAVKRNNWIYVITQEACLSKREYHTLDLLLGYQEKNFDLYFRHISLEAAITPIFGKLGFGQFYLDGVYRKNGNTFGLELGFKHMRALDAIVGFATKQKGVDLKAKVDLMNQNLHLSAKGRLNNTFAWTLATNVPINGNKPKSNGVLPLPLGFTLETTI